MSHGRHGHYPGLAKAPLYILTSAAGVTCCEASPPALMKEMSRLPHIAPVKVAHWVLTDEPTMHGGWKRMDVFSWP